MEKMSGIAESIFERYCITDKDILITVSTSGKNVVPVEMAKVATELGFDGFFQSKDSATAAYTPDFSEKTF